MTILGISALYHDSAATIIRDGEIIAAAQEERFSRIKADSRIPVQAIKFCLQYAGIKASDLDCIIYYDNPYLTLDRCMSNLIYISNDRMRTLESAYDNVFKNRVWIHEYIRLLLPEYFSSGKKMYVVNHHYSHAASAFYPSPFQEAAILTIDGVGEWNTTTIGYGKDNKIKILREINYPDSVGLLYSAFTYFCGFKVNFGDYKLMGLAPYGEPVYYDLIRNNLIDIKEDGSFKLNLKYFDFQNGGAMTNNYFDELFGGKKRLPEDNITKREMDMAASVQKVIEEIVLKLAKSASIITGMNTNLVMAGGVALNCVANGVLARSGIFENIWVQPAAGDSGGALGAALLAYYDVFNNKRTVSRKYGQKGSYYGPEYHRGEIKVFLKNNDIPYHEYEKDAVYFDKIAELIEEGNVIGLFEGRMEYGPRALGNRSIIADPRSAQMQSKLNVRIKHRESFRPFAPSVLLERCQDYFDIDYESPYMLFCGYVKDKEDEEFSVHDHISQNEDLIPLINRKRSGIPAVTHVDYSARIQTVKMEDNENYYNIIKAFEKRTGCGVLINTSFNVRGEPIVCSPEDAYKCFMNTDMDVLVLENYIIYKYEQPKSMKRNDVYELD